MSAHRSRFAGVRRTRFVGARLRVVRLIVALATCALTACVMVPVTREVYDADCRMMRREVTLEAAVIGGFASCSGQECSALLATLGIVGAASLVVSGSLAVVGNVVYWLEHEANCRRRNAAGVPTPA